MKGEFKCARCRKIGPLFACGCWTRCECGWMFAKGESCNGPAHSPEAQEYFRNGYWVISDDSGRPYKTRTSSLEFLGKRIAEGTIYGSRKAANAAIRAGVVKREGK